jgi:hypothetical protein
MSSNNYKGDYNAIGKIKEKVISQLYINET